MDELEKMLITAVVALVSWVIKDLFFGSVAKRNEALHREWEYRLKEVWSPLYYWSGIILFDSDSKGWEKHGLKELESLIARCAYLIPKKHYYTLIKLVQIFAGQDTKRPTQEEIIETHNYFYKQIELLNYLLYRSSDLDDVGSRSNVLYPYKYLLRIVSNGILHILIWIVIISLVFGIYWLFTHQIYWPVALIFLIFVIVIIADIRKRDEIKKQIEGRLN